MAIMYNIMTIAGTQSVIDGNAKLEILVKLFLISSMAKFNGLSCNICLIQGCWITEVSYITGVIKKRVWIKNGKMYRTSRYLTLMADKNVPRLKAVNIVTMYPINTLIIRFTQEIAKSLLISKYSNSPKNKPRLMRKSKDAVKVAEMGITNLGKYIFLMILPLPTMACEA